MKIKNKVLGTVAAVALATSLVAPVQAHAESVESRSTVDLVSLVSNGVFFVEARSNIAHTQVRAYSNGNLGPWRNAGTWSLATSVSRANNVRGFDLR